MPKTNNYSQEFKNEVLAYMEATKEPLRAVASHFGIARNSLREWRRRAQAPLGAPEPAVATESPEAELRRLRRENERLRLRCEILKKTVVIFGNASGSDIVS